jgi:AcrR family transcriptional regulator
MIERGVAMVDKSGFQGATVEHVADEAKIAKGTIYLYFDTGLARGMNERAGLDLCICCRAAVIILTFSVTGYYTRPSSNH